MSEEREHVTDGKPCWCGPGALKEGDATIWVHRQLPSCPNCDLLAATVKVLEAGWQCGGPDERRQRADAEIESMLRDGLGRAERAENKAVELANENTALRSQTNKLREALETIGDIARGLRKCRHGRTCCAENDNTVGAINEAVKVLAVLLPPALPSASDSSSSTEEKV